MSLAIQPLSPDLVLPWSPNAEQEKKFEDAVKKTSIALLILFLVIPWLPVFEIDYVEPEDKPIKTKVILKQQPKPVVQQPKVVSKPKPVKAKPKPVPEKPKKPTPKSVAKAKPKAAPKPVDAKAALKKSQGLAQLSNQLSALRGAVNVSGLKNKKVTNNRGGKVGNTSRKRLGKSSATQASGGVNVGDSIMRGSGTQLAGHAQTEVEGVITIGLPGGGESYSSYREGQRDIESIRRSIEREKGAIYALYNRALDRYPDLNGDFIFNLVIEPNGKISEIKLVSSELELGELEQNILSRIQRINFGKSDVSVTSVNYRFAFVPS